MGPGGLLACWLIRLRTTRVGVRGDRGAKQVVNKAAIIFNTKKTENCYCPNSSSS